MQVPPISLQHFEKLMGPYGLYQHATEREPNLAEGYCVDDNARAIMVLLAYLEQSPAQREKAETFLTSCFAFIKDAQHAPGTYYNFRDAKGTWLTHDVSEDMYARLARTYAYILSHDRNQDRKSAATSLLIDLTTTLQSLTAPRAQAETCIAISALPQSFITEHPELTRIAKRHNASLLALWNNESSLRWPWFQESMTYANAILPHSMLTSSQEQAQECLHQSASFLMETTIRNNIFIPIGSVGWYPKGGIASHDNQQAIEAGTMFDFLLAYHAQFPDKVSEAQLLAPYLWFFGHNTNKVVMADKEIGACLDGLFLDHVNPNYGAESMLAYLWTELLMQHAPKSIQESAKNILEA
jgi:hypothetical protein